MTTTHNAATCNHGNTYDNCRICSTRPWECDYGTCSRKYTVEVKNGHGETRKACGKHAKYMG